jgi:sarcosine oxidase
MNKTDDFFDVIVIGVGSMGASTCYNLAKKGIKVLGLEQFDITHEMGSHAGQSRMIRKAYFEHPSYVPLLERAYHNWKQLEKETGEHVYFKTGVLYFGKANHILMSGVNESSKKYNIHVDNINKDQLQKKYPQFRIPDNYQVLFEPDAGFITPERAILLYVEKAIELGATIKTKSKVLEWKEKEDVIEVVTSTKTYKAKKLVITAGAWAPKMIPSIASSLKVTKQIVGWVIPKNNELFKYGKLPCWAIADDAMPGMFYGFPMLPAGKFNGPIGFKLAHHFHGEISDPDTITRIPTMQDEENLKYVLNKFFPDGFKSTHVIKTCIYTNTPDEHFIIDLLPEYKHVIVAAGFSGHGFKFVSVVGEILTDLALNGVSDLPIDFLTTKRLSSFNQRDSTS